MSELLDLRTVNATWQLGPCAEVRVGEHVTRYVRRGSGPGVVLLGVDAGANPLWSPLVAALGTSHRLIIPQPPPNGAVEIACLRGFIEGIGLSDVVLIAGGAAVAPAVELTGADDFIVRKLVVLADESTITPGDPRILAVPMSWSPAAAVSAIEKFLRTASPHGS